MSANQINFKNGRVIEIDNVNYNPMDMTVNNPDTENKNYECKAVINIEEPSAISNLFFSEQNINNIQDTIRYNVYKLSGQTISRQSDTDLKIVMRSYFLQYGKNNPRFLKEQLIDLNNHVLSYCVPRVHDELLQHQEYIRDVQSLPMPIARPMNMSSAGTKYLKSVTETF
jgi:hypothetical protein